MLPNSALSAGALRIGVVASASAMVLPEKLCSFHAKWPGLTVEVVEGVQEQLCNALVNCEIDLVLSTGMPFIAAPGFWFYGGDNYFDAGGDRAVQVRSKTGD
jgi:DNA-binding transcriptional LysR family regulator